MHVEDFEQRLLYRSPGDNNAGRGKTYDCVKPRSQDEVDVLLKDGWYFSMTEALDAFDLAKSSAQSAAVDAETSSLTPEEKAEAAKKAEQISAERLLAAKKALASDEAEADSATSVLTAARAKSAAAEAAKADAVELARVAAAEVAVAEQRSQGAYKALASTKVRAAAAEKNLDDASGKVLTVGALLTAAKEKALAQAAAAEKALADAEAKATAPAAPDDDAKTPAMPKLKGKAAQ